MDYKLKCTGKIISAVFVGILIMVLPELAHGKVTGVCSNCHTMHNSQDGSGMVTDATGISVGFDPNCTQCHNEPRQVLLRMNCLGCHASNINGVSNIDPLTNAPQVALNTNSTPLAGGNYKYVFTDDTYGHNVHGFGSLVLGPDNNLFNTPPGYKAAYDPSSGKYTPNLFPSADQVMCAGRNGCHGNRDQESQMLAVKGSHHAADSMLKFGGPIAEANQGGGTGGTTDFTTTGKSYRFLYNVHGGEDNNWEATLGPGDHNEYKGAAFVVGRSGQTWATVDTISELCAECHGDFHGGADITSGTGSPWLRHPTDAILPDSGEYSAYTAYSTEAPVARVTIPNAPDNQVYPDSDIVMCLSCHRAHAGGNPSTGSGYPDALRWDYSNMSDGTGCYVCHTQKDDNL